MKRYKSIKEKKYFKKEIKKDLNILNSLQKKTIVNEIQIISRETKAQKILITKNSLTELKTSTINTKTPFYPKINKKLDFNSKKYKEMALISKLGCQSSGNNSSQNQNTSRTEKKLNKKNNKINIFQNQIPPIRFFEPQIAKRMTSFSCPYIDQINRVLLDFDNRKLCSKTMSSLNVYACLVCGIYFSGRKLDTPAYNHALHDGHKVFIHLTDARIFCLPEDYEIFDATLGDIKINLHPTFTKPEVLEFDTKVQYSHALDGNDYLPGVLGLNNLTNSCWCNAVVQAILKVKPVRNFFIFKNNYRDKTNSSLILMFAELVRKYHNPKNFKNHISPHEFLQSVLDRSNKKFQVGVHSDPLDFMSWFLRTMHFDLNLHEKKNTIISQTFEGRVLFIHTKLPNHSEAFSTFKKMPFNYLLLELPKMPLFKDAQKEKFIPQVNLQDLLNKFDGKTQMKQRNGSMRKLRLFKLPKYLIIAYRRFKEGYFDVEKNTTIVNCVIKGLNLRPYLLKPEEQRELLSHLTINDLKKRVKRIKENLDSYIDRRNMINMLVDRYRIKFRKTKTKYDLISNITHEGGWKEGKNKCLVFNQSNAQWYEMHDLHVQETIPQLVTVAESYIQIWQQRK